MNGRRFPPYIHTYIPEHCVHMMNMLFSIQYTTVYDAFIMFKHDMIYYKRRTCHASYASDTYNQPTIPALIGILKLKQ